MALIDISHLTFAYDGAYDNIFEDVSFQIDTDWRLGFTGRNGRGKTTLLNLLMGKYEYSGSISAPVSFEYFPFRVRDPKKDTLKCLYEVNPEFELWELNRELSLLGMDESALYRPFETLSNGERTKALLAALTLKEHRFLLIDEPTNHLDLRARGLVSDYLKRKKGFILVSHDRAFLDNCVDHILSINRADIEIQRGSFSSFWANKLARDGFELAENERLKKDIKRLSEAARRTARWSDKVEATKIGGHVYDRGAVGHKAAKMMKRSKATEVRRQEAVEQKSALLKNLESAESLKLAPLLYHSGRVAEVRDLRVAYGEHAVFEGLNFTIGRGERVALIGSNGSGKSSVLKLLLGEAVPHSGEVYVGSGVKLSYVSQDTSSLSGDLRSFAIEHGIDESLFKAILRKLDFSRAQFDKNIEEFSEGQKKKALIARSLCESAHLYLWDEPLNFIDVLSRMQIEELLLEYAPTMIFVEHDAAFAERIATKRVELCAAHPS